MSERPERRCMVCGLMARPGHTVWSYGVKGCTCKVDRQGYVCGDACAAVVRSGVLDELHRLHSDHGSGL